ncbi:MAG: acetyltransferase [Cytophagales bacterium]|nr:acetyltransferase [Cytophaga sp.]
MKKIVLIGAGGHCKSCIDVIDSQNEWSIYGILDAHVPAGSVVLGHTVLGGDEMIASLIQDGYSFLITIGQIKTADLRETIFNKIKAASGRFATVVSAYAIVSRYSVIGEGSIIMHGAVVNADALIGENCIINTCAIIEHDAKVGKHSHVSTNAVLNGGVNIGTHCFIGSGSVLVHGIAVCDHVIVGANATVTKSIENASTYVGSPAQSLKNR